MLINSETIKDTVYNLCLMAAQNLSFQAYEILREEYKKNPSQKLSNILENAKTAAEKNKPLCQDTGTVHVFLDIGNDVYFDKNLYKAINEGVSKCYKENFFRKSITENLLISAKNTRDNTPAIIETEYHQGNDVVIRILLKGAGCDNVSSLEMMLPNTTKEDLIDFVSQKVLKKGKNACPPLFITVACGGSASNVLKNAEKNYFSDKKNELAEKIKNKINSCADKKYNNFFAADVKLSLYPHHMASFPVGISINCHSLRIAQAKINSDNSVIYSKTVQNYEEVQKSIDNNIKEVFTSDLESIKNLKEGENILLTGEILIARDAAHRKMKEILDNGGKLPLEIKDKIIFYAAPCPPKSDEITGSIGPTTSSRMDKYISEFPQVAGTIGKGVRSKAVQEYIRKNNKVYFEVEGGIAATLSSKFTSYKIIAFEELLSEAVAIATVKELPVTVSIAKTNKNI